MSTFYYYILTSPPSTVDFTHHATLFRHFGIWKLKIAVLAWMVIILLTHSLHFVGFKFVRQTVIWRSVHLYLLRMAPSKCLQKCKCVPKMCQLWLVTTFLKWWSGHNLCSTYIFIWTLSYGEIFKSTSVYL